MIIVAHLVSSPQVTLRNWLSLFAETMTVDPMRVVSIHKMSHDTSALFPIPRPEATAARRACSTASGARFSRMCLVIVLSTSLCQRRGPLNRSSGVFFCPHGNANSTNASGSSTMVCDHN